MQEAIKSSAVYRVTALFQMFRHMPLICHPQSLINPLLTPFKMHQKEQEENNERENTDGVVSMNSYMASLLEFTIGSEHTLYKISSSFLPVVTELLHVSMNLLRAISCAIKHNAFVVFFWFRCPNATAGTSIYTFPLTYFEKGAIVPDVVASTYVNLCFTNTADRSAHNIHNCVQHFVILSNIMQLLQSTGQHYFHGSVVYFMGRRAVLMLRTQNVLHYDCMLALSFHGLYVERTRQQKGEIPLIYDDNCLLFLVCHDCGNIASVAVVCPTKRCYKCTSDILHVLYTSRTAI